MGSPRGGHGPSSLAVSLPMLVYLVPSANLLVTGIGTVRFRRWARLATLISAGIWLGLGTLMIASLVIAVGLAPHHAVGLSELFVISSVMAIPFFGLSITILVLYTRSGVQATLDRRSGG